jgi:DNA-directed RNA polymerase II subunit RPB2
MECSDNYRVFICQKCRSISNVNPAKNIYSCKFCNNELFFKQIRIGYAAKLLFQEIQAMSINTKFITD